MALIPRPTTRRGAVFELVAIVALAIGLALAIQAFIVKPYQIPSGSMKPTLAVGQRVLVDRIFHGLGDDPEVGDIVVFHPPLGAVSTEQPAGEAMPKCAVARRPGEPCPEGGTERADTNFIKRVVAGPGDRLSIDHGHPVVNGVVADEDFAAPCGGGPECDLPREIAIPDDHYFLMGDNRGASEDSRSWGPVPGDWIIGQAFFTYWPLDRVGFL
jgi:signal peptidase I